MANKTFSIYTFQIVPLSMVKQTELFGTNVTYEELVDQKNILFSEALLSDHIKFKGHGYVAIPKIEFSDSFDILLRLGVEKNKERNTLDFKREVFTDYPNVLVYINNRNDRQIVAIENNLNAFTDTNAVANILKEAVNSILRTQGLVFYIEQKFNPQQFWDTLKEYEGRIITLRFEFIKPNMSSISQNIKRAFQNVESSTNSHKTVFSLHAPEGATLENLNKDNEVVNAIVDYQSEGGGPPPVIRVKNIRHNIKTVNKEKTFELSEYEGSPETLIELFKVAMHED